MSSTIVPPAETGETSVDKEIKTFGVDIYELTALITDKLADKKPEGFSYFPLQIIDGKLVYSLEFKENAFYGELHVSLAAGSGNVLVPDPLLRIGKKEDKLQLEGERTRERLEDDRYRVEIRGEDPEDNLTKVTTAELMSRLKFLLETGLTELS